MHATLEFYLYGTIAPDLRTLKYHDSGRAIRFPSTMEEVFRLDTVLKGPITTPFTNGDRDIIAGIYASLPIDGELLKFMETYHRAGGTVEIVMPPEPLLNEYRSLLPTFFSVCRKSDPISSDSERRAIIVSGQMERVENVLKAGKPAIHFLSASRLRRELELQGIVDPHSDYRVHEENGG